ncbi:hypothetical protein OROMI_022777 [Orobanche minor]
MIVSPRTGKIRKRGLEKHFKIHGAYKKPHTSRKSRTKAL